MGLTRLVDPAARDFLAARGGRVVTGTAVEAAGPGGVTLADGTTLPTDAVVLALPPQRVVAVSPAALAADPGLGASPIVNVHVWYDRPVMDEPFTAIVDSPVQWIFNRTVMGGGDGRAHHLAISISGAREEVEVPRAELAEAMRAELEHLVPARPRGHRPGHAVVKEPQATFAAAPGQAARRPGPATPLERVALAGAWTATGWPATMEGAVRSGIAAARHVLGAWVGVSDALGNARSRRWTATTEGRSDVRSASAETTFRPFVSRATRAKSGRDSGPPRGPSARSARPRRVARRPTRVASAKRLHPDQAGRSAMARQRPATRILLTRARPGAMPPNARRTGR